MPGDAPRAARVPGGRFVISAVILFTFVLGYIGGICTVGFCLTRGEDR